MFTGYCSEKELAEITREPLHKIRTVRNQFKQSVHHRPEGMELVTCSVIIRHIQRDMDREMANTLECENLILNSRLKITLQKLEASEIDLRATKAKLGCQKAGYKWDD